MDYIYEKRKGHPQTFLELYGKEEIFNMLGKGYIEINDPYRGNWFITKKGVKAVIEYNPQKYKPTIIKKIFTTVSFFAKKKISKTN